MKSKILAAVSDPASPLTSVFVAESAGYVRRINLEVCLSARSLTNFSLEPRFISPSDSASISASDRLLVVGAKNHVSWTQGSSDLSRDRR